MLEKTVEAYLVERVRALGGTAYKFTSPARANVPDRIVILPPGRIYFVELKRPGGKLTCGQEREHEHLRRLGADVRTLDSIGAINAFLNGVQAVAAAGAAPTGTPFENCQFRNCDLPGQCKAEGKCHHPRAAVSPATAEPRECCNADCGWKGDVAETVTMKHGFPAALCPRCHEVTECGEKTATADERAAFIEAIVPILTAHGHKDIAEQIANRGVDENQLPYRMFVAGRASQVAAPAEAREPLVLWKDGTGMLWDTYSHGKWMHRVVSPHGWDAHGVAQHLYGKGYAGHLEVRAVWSGNYAVPADAEEAVLTAAARDVLAERARQISVEGWTPEHDDQYVRQELERAAICYIVIGPNRMSPDDWPFHPRYWRPAEPRRELVKAAALLIAAIERLDRAKAREQGAQGGKGGEA